ncbi:SDR family oxidoreductase [Nitratireductor thuwali]|uniref:Quinone oxidoreductase 2 n=1 Tax=Nitratireductor thuwali TaxID=2267699 RepID=A0ABY5MDF0_9HYPH|nr:Quinone oxidoreductase 2 [Nitratireductor thuwali]
MNKILITGASGQLGGLVVKHLLETENVSPTRLIAGSRDPSKLSALAARGVETAKVDFDDPESLMEAFGQADTALIISTDALDEPGKRLRQHKAAVEAAAKAGVKHLAYTSMPRPEPGNPVLFAPDHHGTEQTLKASGIPYTIFRNSWYQENLLMSLPKAIQSGTWYTSAGDGKTAHIARDDAARAIAASLAKGPVANTTYTLTGAKAYTNAEIAALAAEATGKPVNVVNLSDEALADGMKAAGVPEAFVPLLVSFEANTRAGGLAEVTGDFEQLTGRQPKPLTAFLEESKALLSGAAG